jgi:hypothetical protein
VPRSWVRRCEFSGPALRLSDPSAHCCLCSSQVAIKPYRIGEILKQIANVTGREI